jgi:ribosomal protein S18 acetylase RimI-like enzyme
MRKLSFDEYREKWMSTSQPETYLSDLARMMKEKRTIAEILEEDDFTVGYLWVTFTDVKDYDLTIAGIMDIAVAPNYQRRGIGTMMLRRAAKLAKKRGATLLRSDTGIENAASKRLHESFGFKLYRVNYEKILR